MTLHFPVWLRRSARPFLLLAALAAIAPEARAEGSKNLTPGTGTRGTATGANNFVGYLQHNDGDVASATSNSRYFLKEGAPADQRLYVRMNGGETLYFGVRRIRSNDAAAVNNGRLRLQVKYLDGNNAEQVASTHYLEPQTTSTEGAVNLAPSQPGYIATPEEAAAGPRYLAGNTSPAAGYNPFVYAPVASAPARDYWVEFMEVDAAGSAVGVAQNKSWYDLWDFTVRDATSEKPGRLYSQHWSFTAAGGTNALSSSFVLYPLIPNLNFNNQSFFVKRVSYAGIQPFGVILVANSQGTNVAGNFKDKRKSQNSNAGYPEYKLFVNNPDPVIYPTSPRPNNPTVTTSCSGGVTTFTLRVDQAGFGVVFIDGDRNNLYDRTQDRVLEKPTVIGDNTFVWDGKTDAGTTMNQTNLSVTFSSGVGPVNFPIWDCEQAPDTGISVQDVRPGNDGAADYIFWNDSLLGPSFSNPYINPIGGNTTATSHRWASNAGNEKLVNSYAVGLLARGNAIQIVYDPVSACATTPPVVLQPLPVQLVAFTARAQRNGVALQWRTASETHSAYFEVERSVDGRQFAPVGRVAAQGTSTTLQQYAFIDVTPPAGPLYYRLHQLDVDGTGQHSSVEVVTGSPAEGFTLYPNPATATLHVQLRNALTGPVTLRILDATGRVVWQEQRTLPASQRVLDVSVTNLPTGRSYLLQVQTATGSVVQRFVK
ncbi:T9SS type A sorting domain-containing protein [Hymenobacter perfusus]|uniref:T9SS C-terminal target domain-containing protein n=1 Tax=Hymenobacter perfusus TaxID=1236770 RepID=A0A428KIF8_9BACT|nr:T9SS type A sorting domain-containing protein [Hymenobacter perfusus]RSK46249.1 T9SS C-terminal target domain-containing protein [Hymenobacter perfusus]